MPRFIIQTKDGKALHIEEELVAVKSLDSPVVSFPSEESATAALLRLERPRTMIYTDEGRYPITYFEIVPCS